MEKSEEITKMNLCCFILYIHDRRRRSRHIKSRGIPKNHLLVEMLIVYRNINHFNELL